MKLRRATPLDVPAAARIIGAALAEHDLPFEPEGRDADVAELGSRRDHDDLVAEDDDGEVIGIASVGPQGDRDGLAWISKVFVAKSARRQGVGRALLDAAHEAAALRGFREVGLRTRAIFVEAIALYERAGYTLHEDPASLAMVDAGDRVYYRALRGP